LEWLFGPAQVVDDMEKKKHACQYVDIDTADLWEAIPEFNVTKTFDKFKSTIFKLYPSSEFEHKWNFMDSYIRLMSSTFSPLPTSDSLPLSFPNISTLAQATDLSEEDTIMLGTTNTDIDDYILAPQSVQAKVNHSCLLKVFQWLQDLGRPDSLSDAEYATFMWYSS
jgi:hypothetical protein